MNAYYHQTGLNIGTVGMRRKREVAFGDRFISFICALVAAVTCPVAVKLEKAAVATGLIFAFIGVIGGMEANTIGLFWGFVLCVAIALVELLIFASMTKKTAKK